jgi:hypothetical protein
METMNKQKREFPEHPEGGTALFLQRLFEKMADATPGHLAIERWVAEDAYVLKLDLASEDEVLLRQVKMVANESGFPLVRVSDPAFPLSLSVMVSPLPSAVLAIMRHCC